MCLKHLGKLTKYDYYIIKSKDSILIIRRGGTFLPTPGHIRVKAISLGKVQNYFFPQKCFLGMIIQYRYCTVLRIEKQKKYIYSFLKIGPKIFDPPPL